MSKQMEEIQEPVLVDPGYERFSLFPIKHQDIWKDFYKKHKDAFWTASFTNSSHYDIQF